MTTPSDTGPSILFPNPFQGLSLWCHLTSAPAAHSDTELATPAPHPRQCASTRPQARPGLTSQLSSFSLPTAWQPPRCLSGQLSVCPSPVSSPTSSLYAAGPFLKAFPASPATRALAHITPSWKPPLSLPLACARALPSNLTENCTVPRIALGIVPFNVQFALLPLLEAWGLHEDRDGLPGSELERRP